MCIKVVSQLRNVLRFKSANNVFITHKVSQWRTFSIALEIIELLFTIHMMIPQKAAKKPNLRWRSKGGDDYKLLKRSPWRTILFNVAKRADLRDDKGAHK